MSLERSAACPGLRPAGARGRAEGRGGQGVIDVGARVRLNLVPEGGALHMGTGLGTVVANDYDPYGFGGPFYIVQLDEGAWVWEGGLPHIPTDYNVIAPEYLEAV